MGIRFQCPNGHPIHVKSFLAGKRGICPHCEAKFIIPQESGGQAQPAPRKKRKSWTEDGAGERLTAAAPTSGPAGAPVSAPVEQGAIPQGQLPQGQTAAASAPVFANAAPAQATTPVDPIAEAPQAMWYVRPPTGGQFGPAAGEILRKWIGEGRVSAESMVWREGWTDWRQAGQALPQLRDVMHPAPSAPAPVFGDSGVAAVKTHGGSGYARRRKSNSLTVAIVVLMILLAIVLAAIFAWVLNKQSAPADDKQPTARAARLHDRDVILASAGRPEYHRAPAVGYQRSAISGWKKSDY
jgi:hypothetical protein